MRVLFLSISSPRKDGKGYEILLYQRIKFLLLRGISVDLVISSISDIQMGDLIEQQNLSGKFHFQIFKLGRVGLFKNTFRTIFQSKLPIQVGVYYNKKLVLSLEKYLQNNKVDYIVSNLIRPLNCIPKLYQRGVVIDALDSMALNFKRRVYNSKFMKKTLLKFEYDRLKHFEKCFHKSQIVITVAKLDLDYIKGGLRYCIELGVNETDKSVIANNQFDKYVFSGNMNYGPNIDAYNYLNNEIWPIIKSINPDAELYIAGRGSKSLQKNHDSIKLVGRVPVMSDYLAKMDVAIAPMRLGSGMQFKILEALAVGLPVITTQLGLGSINAEIGKDVFLFSKIHELSKQIEMLKTVGARSKQRQDFIRRNHSWESANTKFLKIMTESNLK